MHSNPKEQTRRADAQRNRAAILAAAPRALRRSVDASMAEIAAEAGLGRMTVYGHFATRAELLEAAVTASLERGDAVLSRLPLDGPPVEAFARLIESSWMLLDEARGLLLAAQKELPPDRVRELHAVTEERMRRLLERGRRDGAFRTDLPVRWLLSSAHAVMNAAADDVVAGRVSGTDAAYLILAVLVPAITAPAGGDPGTGDPHRKEHP